MTGYQRRMSEEKKRSIHGYSVFIFNYVIM